MRIVHVLPAFVMLAACHNGRPGHGVTANLPPITNEAVAMAPAAEPEPARSVPAPPDNIQPRETKEAAASTLAANGAESITKVNRQLQDIFYPYDRSDLTEEASRILRKDADLLAEILTVFPALKVTVEGHCDERGSAEYNLALGDTRAAHTAEALRSLGLPLPTLETVSYGKENPQCSEADESCWHKNRRAHFVVSLPFAAEPQR